MSNKNLSNLYKKHKGHWVSISEDYSKVFASSEDLDELTKQIEKKKLNKGVIMRIPLKKYSAYVG